MSTVERTRKLLVWECGGTEHRQWRTLRRATAAGRDELPVSCPECGGTHHATFRGQERRSPDAPFLVSREGRGVVTFDAEEVDV